MLISRTRDRRGATLVEAAMVYPVLFLLLIAIIVLSILVFRKQQVNYLAREGARWAAVHGADYAAEANTSPTTSTDVHINSILPQAVGMDTTKLTAAVTWSNDDRRPTRTVVETVGGAQVVVSRANTVTVVVQYKWDTGTLFGSYDLTGTSVATMQF